jgi:hypothetical protein
MSALRKSSQSFYQLNCRVRKSVFNLSPQQAITVVKGIEPRSGDLVIILLDGHRRFGRCLSAGIELSNGTITPFATIIGVVDLKD